MTVRFRPLPLMIKTYRYKARVSKSTANNAAYWLARCCNIYNAAVEQRKTIYAQHKVGIYFKQQSAELKGLHIDLPEFAVVDAQVRGDALKRVDKAFSNFFRGKQNYPKFKSVKRYKSFTLNQCSWKLEGRYLKIRNVGTFKLFLHRPLEGVIKNITVKQDAYGDWFVFFCCEVPDKEREPAPNLEVGIDLGLQYYAVDSDGKYVENPRHFRKAQAKIRRKDRSVSRKKNKRSNSRRKAVKLRAKAYRKVARQRLDFQFKLANYYVSNYEKIVLEKLQVQNMLKNKHLSKSISDAAWYTFKEIMKFKCKEYSRIFKEVDPKYTSQMCTCGELVKKSLSERLHKCLSCGIVICRDLNAAINILHKSVRAERLCVNVAH